jgi:coenzyme F420-reducing hydrogenase alpha subunit
MQKIVTVCKRIEGHGNVEIYLQNDQVSNISFNLSIFRGFENILKNKELLDVPLLASRICGLCHSSQIIASCKAIESLYNIQPSKRSILLRRLLMAGELIKSHSIHQFLQSLPDLLYIFKHKSTPPSHYDLIQFDYELATKFYELINIGNEIDRIFGGRSIHVITTFPGGVNYSYSQNDNKLAKKYIQKAIENLEYIIERYIKLFASTSPPDIFNISRPIYMSLHDNESYDRYRGNIGINYENNKKLNFSVENYPTYFDKDPELRGINFLNEEIVLVDL